MMEALSGPDHAGYSASRRRVAGLEAWVLSSASGGEAVILPGLGGTVHSLSLGGTGPLLRPDGDGELGANPRFRGRLLFPFNDRIPGGRYSFMGREYRLPPNESSDGSAIHGFLYRKAMHLRGVRAGYGYAALVLGLDLGDDEEEGYPFRLSLRVLYRLDSGGFRLRMSVRNRGSAAAPLAYGWHPYFSLPGRLPEWTLTHRGSRYVPIGPDLLPLGKLRGVHGGGPDFRRGRALGDGLVDIALEAVPGPTTLVSGDASVCVAASLPPFSFTQIYVPPERDSVAIEPVSAATDSFNRRSPGLIALGPGERSSGSILVRASTAARG